MDDAMRIDKHRPVNKTAKNVIVKAGIDNEFDALQDAVNRGQNVFWKSPRAGAEIPKSLIKSESFIGLTGLEIFRSKIVNYQGNGFWQLRCCCGNYYIKKTKKIKTAKAEDGICQECRRRYDMVRHNDYLKHGFNKHDIDWYILNR